MAPTFKPAPIRCFQKYSSDDRADRASSHRMKHQQKMAVGEFYYVHPAVPGRAFTTAAAARRAAAERTFALCEAA